MTRLTRRDLLRTAGAGAAAVFLSPLAARADVDKPGFTLPKLPYGYDALEPYIDARTMQIHHDLHHMAYVNNLNTALKGHAELEKKSIVDLIRDLKSVPENIRTAVRNNGGGHLNHTWFWQMMAPKAGGTPKGEVARAIDEAFGSFDKFQAALSDAAMKRFGSGWAWLVVDKGKLAVVSSANQDNPISEGASPVLGIDVWEHAYYLKYQNKRADYVKAWWNTVNWDYVADQYKAAARG